MLRELGRDLAHERVLDGIELRPARGDLFQERCAVHVAAEPAGPDGVLTGQAQDEAEQSGGGVELGLLGNARRRDLRADPLKDAQHGVVSGIAGQLGADPGMRVEHAERERADGATYVAGRVWGMDLLHD